LGVSFLIVLAAPYDFNGKCFESKWRGIKSPDCNINLFADHSDNSLSLFFSCFKVKIWFQNKRSKYKKIMKHGSGSEGDHFHSTSSVSPCSPALPQLWEVSMTGKGAPMHPNNYMNSFGPWYPNHHPHQDTMPRPQMM